MPNDSHPPLIVATCGNCAHGRPSPNGEGLISCRARPPVVCVHDVYVSHGHTLTGEAPVKATQVLSEWPTIPAHEWCSAHRQGGQVRFIPWDDPSFARPDAEPNL